MFSFAKIWAADRDSLEEIGDGADSAQQADSWAQTLQRLADEMAKQREEEATGRGVRRRAAAVFPAVCFSFHQVISDIDHHMQQQLDHGDTPKKGNKKGKKGKANPTAAEDSDAYAASIAASEDDSISNASAVDDDFLPPPQPQKGKHIHFNDLPDPALLSPILNTPDLSRSPPKKAQAHVCGLCGTIHSDDACFMTESAENLAEFRNILLSHAGDETIEERVRTVLQLIVGFDILTIQHSALP